MQKKLSWDDVSEVYDPEVEAKAKSIPTKAYERFWGTDVDDDPMELIRLTGQVGFGVGGAIAGAKVGGAAGAMVGGPGGAAVGAGVGGLVGGFAGGMAGTAAPEMAMEAAELLGIADKGTREKIGLSDKQLNTVMEGEAILDMVTAGGLSAARMSVRTATKALSGMGVLPFRGRAAKEMTEFAAEYGINMLPVQVGKRTLPRAFVAILGKFPLVAAPIKRNIVNTETQVRKAFEALPANIAPIATANDVTHSVFMDLQNVVRKTATEMDANYKDIYKRADAAGARVTPSETAGRIISELEGIKKTTPRAYGFQKEGTHTAVMEGVRTFLRDDLGKIFKQKANVNSGPTSAVQTFEQMDTVLGKIDEQIAKIAGKKGSDDAVDVLQSVRQATEIDMYQNVTGANVGDIVADLRALDREYTNTITDLFEMKAKKDFVPKGEQLDRVTDVLMKGTDVSELEDVSRLMTKPTFQKLAAYSINKKIWDVYDKGGKLMDMDELRTSFGFNNPNGDLYKHTKRMLELSGGLNMEDLGKIIEIGTMVGRVEAPNASQFVMRRGVMSGAEGIFKGLVPTVGTSAVAGSVGGLPAALVGSMAFLGGSHMVGRMISDPRIARPLHKVLDKEVPSLVRKGAALQVGRLFANAMIQDDEYSVSEGFQWLRNYEKHIGGIYRYVQDQEKAK